MNEFIQKLYKGFEENDISDLLSERSANLLCKLYSSLIETNKITNLTAITDENEVILKHFLDSATVCKYIPKGASVIDIGCGAGFPSLPIAILRDDVQVTSLDSTGKKIEFVKSFAKASNLSNSTAINARAEEFVANNREQFDICVSRAVARLNVLSELCIPFVKTEGSFIAMKASKGNEEYEEAKAGISKLGAELSSLNKNSIIFHGDTIEREIYVFKKTKKTPQEFPRRYAQMLKRPL